MLLEKNCELKPNSPEYLTSLADAYFKNDDLDKAKQYYKKALEAGLKNDVRSWYLNQLKSNALK